MENLLVLISKNELQALIEDAMENTWQERRDPPPDASQSIVMDIDAFCNYTGLSKQTVYRKTRSGNIPHSKRGKRLYFDRKEVDEWLLANKVNAKIVEEQTSHFFTKNRAKR